MSDSPVKDSQADPALEEAMRRWIEEHCEPERTMVYFGYDWTEEHRLDRAKPHWRPWRIEAQLTWQPVMDKSDVLAMFKQAGIEPPWLTRTGMPHANSGGGCVKAGVNTSCVCSHLIRLSMRSGNGTSGACVSSLATLPSCVIAKATGRGH